jgi:hypothetical protein
MNVVVYDRDFDPVTVVEVDPHYMRDGASVRFLVSDPIRSMASLADSAMHTAEIATIRFERFNYRGRGKLVAFTDEPELMVRVKPAYLPGQILEEVFFWPVM